MITYSQNRFWIYWPLVWTVLFAIIMWTGSVDTDTVYDPGTVKLIPSLENTWYYAFILAASIIFPFLLSFDKNVHFYTRWAPLFKATGIVAVFFIIWDIVFTAVGVWGFNDAYILGFKFAGLPIEEWLWFFIIPYCCIFIYECLNFYIKKDPLLSIQHYITWILIPTFLVIGLYSWGQLYTSLTFLSAAGITFYHHFFHAPEERSRFFLAWIVSIIPFYLVNGALTGAFTNEAIVVYAPSEFTGIRWGTIPIDDAVYLYVFLLWIITIYEGFKKK